MIYGNHEMRKGDVVKVARWDDRALLQVAWHLGVKSASGPQRRSVCSFIGDMTFFVSGIDYHLRQIHVVPMGTLSNGRLAPAKKAKAVVGLDDTNLIRVGRLEN